MVEVFRRRVITLLVQRELLNENFARNLLSWKHSGFSIDNSVRILDESAQESLAEYIARPPRMHGRAVSEANDPADLAEEDPLRNRFKGRVLFPHENTRSTLSKNLPHVRRPRLPRRTHSTHSAERIAAHPALRALCFPHEGTVGKKCLGSRSGRPRGGRPPINATASADDLGYEPLSDGDEEVTVDPRKRAWVQRFAKRYRKTRRARTPGEGVRGRSNGVPKVRQGHESHRRY
jgi:hypothetical protein